MHCGRRGVPGPPDPGSEFPRGRESSSRAGRRGPGAPVCTDRRPIRPGHRISAPGPRAGRT
eukprot:749995-Hanusia_phi.AAC.1